MSGFGVGHTNGTLVEEIVCVLHALKLAEKPAMVLFVELPGDALQMYGTCAFLMMGKCDFAQGYLHRRIW